MADQLKNLSGLFKNSRSRSIILVTVGLLTFMFIAGIVSFKKHSTTLETGAALQGTPAGLQSVPGGFEQPETAEYAKLQNQQNLNQAKKAQASGDSAIPTITSSTTVTGAWQGGNFSSLNQAKPALPNNYLLKTNQSTNGSADSEGIPVYNQQGLMTGLAYGKDDKTSRVCVMGCSAVGTVDPDGFIRDAKGNIIGKVASSALGTPVYDAQGRLIGYAGADGKVRDLKGTVVGSIGPDGVFKTNDGKPGNAGLGVPVYDANGRLIGYAGPDGKVRGLNGNVIGTVDADGTVRDASGKILGKAGSSQLGTPIYDAKGRLIGYAGADGKIRDLNGNLVGTVGADGVIRDLHGKILGKTNALNTTTALGTPVYDSKGRLIGYASPDGTVKDATGKIVGHLGADGTLRDANGNIIGTAATQSTRLQNTGTPASAPRITPPPSDIPNNTSGLIPPSSIPATESEQLDAIRQRQAQQLAQQKLQQNQQQLTSTMTGQQSLLFSAWATTSTQQYVAGEKDKDEKGESGQNNGMGSANNKGNSLMANASAANQTPFLKSGEIMFAVLNTSVNTDEPGPIMATIVGTKFKGGKLLGTLVNQGEKVMLTFNVMSLPNVSKSISINAVAIDPDTARTALSNDTDHHYLLRYGTLFASSFMQGYGQAVQQSGSVVVTNGLNTQTNMPDLTAKGQALAALGTVGQAWGQAARSLFSKPPTVQVYSGTGLGILLLQDVLPPTS